MNNNRLYGLIGYQLSHSFSQGYFTEKFAKEGLDGYSYRLFPIDNIDKLFNLLEQHNDLHGFNVTIPYKEQIITYMDELDIVAEKTGAVNTVQVIRNGKDIYLKGYNTDVFGFSQSLQDWFKTLNRDLPTQALVLGTGGASKAVVYALNCLNITTSTVSRKTSPPSGRLISPQITQINTETRIYAADCQENNLCKSVQICGQKTYEKSYNQLNADDITAHPLIINTTPLGMYPNINESPVIPYNYLTEKHYLYDLVYNPAETLFMRKGLEMGVSVLNGIQMLHLQADKAWEIWSLEM